MIILKDETKEKNLYLNKRNEHFALKNQSNEKEYILSYEVCSEFKQYILSLEEKQCYNTRLYPDTTTIVLLDDFCSSKKDFLIFQNQFKSPKNRVYISLIITPNYSFIESENT